VIPQPAGGQADGHGLAVPAHELRLLVGDEVPFEGVAQGDPRDLRGGQLRYRLPRELLGARADQHAQGGVGEPDEAVAIAQRHQLGGGAHQLFRGECRREVRQAMTPDGPRGDEREPRHRLPARGIHRHPVGGKEVDERQVSDQEGQQEGAGTMARRPRRRPPPRPPELHEREQEQGHERNREQEAPGAEDRIGSPGPGADAREEPARSDQDRRAGREVQPCGPHERGAALLQLQDPHGEVIGGRRQEGNAQVGEACPDERRRRVGRQVHPRDGEHPPGRDDREQAEGAALPRAVLPDQREGAHAQQKGGHHEGGYGSGPRHVRAGVQQHVSHRTSSRPGARAARADGGSPPRSKGKPHTGAGRVRR
jgi:hypothetical protein